MVRVLTRALHDARRQAIRQLIRSRRIPTQEELRALLAAEGFVTTQATLSRDLAWLGARRAALPGGGTVYELEDAPAPDGDAALSRVAQMVVAVVATDTLVLVHTTPGGAAPVALALDRARLEEVAGSIAGDDTVLLAPARGRRPSSVARRLERLWGLRA